MRTEIKAGLIVGLIVISVGVFYAVNRAGPGDTADHIPFPVKAEEGRPPDPGAAGVDRRPVAKSTSPRDEMGRPATARPPSDRSARGEPTVPPGAPGVSPPTRTALPPLRHTEPPLTGATGETGVPAGPPVTPPAADPVSVTTAPIDLQAAERPVTTPPAAGPEPLSAEPTAQPEPILGPVVALPPRPTETPRPVEPAERLREAEKPAPVPTRYTVERGDTLCGIARDYYGNAALWVRIRDANPGIDPDRLRVGQVLVLPSKDERPTAASVPGAGRATYVAERGDTLTSIARQVLGDGSRWREIYELNRDKLTDPNRLLPGTELRMPPIPPPKTTTTKP